MDVESVGEVLFNRFAKLHHAINLRDFVAYCRRRALLSRSELSKSTRQFTEFYSDETDQQRGLWERVFGNLQDFGVLFWAAPACTPNAYGPITLVLNRNVWDQVDDIAVTRRNAATRDFVLAAERMPAEEVASCFEQNESKFWQLQSLGLEVSLGTAFLSLALVEQVIVEPISPDLVDRVRQAWISSGHDGSLVMARTLWKSSIPQERLDTFLELVKWSSTLAGRVPLASDLKRAVPRVLGGWTSGLRDSQWPPLRQWLEYTYNGTIRELGNIQG